MNDDKTETLLMKSNSNQFSWGSAHSSSYWHCRHSVHDLCSLPCFINLNNMTLDKYISTVYRFSYVEIRGISSIHQYLTIEATKTLVCAFVLSKLDYCNSLLSGCPLYLLSRLQKVQNSAKLVFKARKRDHVQPLLQALHWLPVQATVRL